MQRNRHDCVETPNTRPDQSSGSGKIGTAVPLALVLERPQRPPLPTPVRIRRPRPRDRGASCRQNWHAPRADRRPAPEADPAVQMWHRSSATVAEPGATHATSRAGRRIDHLRRRATTLRQSGIMGHRPVLRQVRPTRADRERKWNRPCTSLPNPTRPGCSIGADANCPVIVAVEPAGPAEVHLYRRHEDGSTARQTNPRFDPWAVTFPQFASRPDREIVEPRRAISNFPAGHASTPGGISPPTPTGSTTTTRASSRSGRPSPSTWSLTGATFFKEMAFAQLRRMQLDLETLGLDPTDPKPKSSWWRSARTSTKKSC